ncbi:protein-disulfide reductase DsbD domain-containing protein [Fluviibacterium sp. DFM31]|uniref:Protein-disulfide reductase DsbD domain-containing protein n=1 Tax=Meridianimarinicoccus marinus TaxID=3231483 RepID=A0ABV3L2C3_9RHOB
MTSFRALIASSAFALWAGASSVAAQDMGDLIGITVLDGWQTERGTVMAGLRITLDAGWKTYWRNPGDSGIPPQFDWGASDNLRAVQVYWPRPEIFQEAGAETLGYMNEFVLPVELFPRDAAAPMRLDGLASVGVCREVCVPVEAVFGGTVGQGDPGHAQAIRGALAAQPDRVDGPRTVSCRVTPIADGLQLTARIAVPSQGTTERVVFETGRQDLWISAPVTSREGHILVATAELVPPEARPFAFSRSELRVTVLGQTRAVEMKGCKAS